MSSLYKINVKGFTSSLLLLSYWSIWKKKKENVISSIGSRRDYEAFSVSAHTEVRSGDDRVGLIGQHLLPFVDGVNPRRFDEVQVAVLHQRLRQKVRVVAGGRERS